MHILLLSSSLSLSKQLWRLDKANILSVITQNLKSLMTPNTPFGVVHCSALVLISINVHTKFEVPSFTCSEDMIGALILKNG